VLNIVRIRNRSQSRNRNQNFSQVGTGNTTNHYGSTALDHGRDEKEGRFNRRKEKKDITNLKVPKCEIFQIFDFNDFYGIKSL
jgi:hypothetical protein